MGRKRDKGVLVFVTEKELLRIKNAASKVHLNISEYIRQCCLTRSRMYVQDRNVLVDLLKEVNGVASMLNRMMIMAHQSDIVTDQTMRLAAANVADLREEMRKIKYPQQE